MDWHTLSETIKNFVEVAAILAGVLAVWKWLHERYDRATDVLLELEKKFNEPECVRGRALIEDDIAYGKIVPLLHTAVLEAIEPIPLKETKLSDNEIDQLAPLDSLLRFYVLLHGIRKARQVPDAPLRTCFRYWLTQYYCPYRPAFRAYVDTFYPTLEGWLHDDAKESDEAKRFFTPVRFGWSWDDKKKTEQFRRAIGGRVLVLTGSGISADSGIPTFRGPDGYWRQHNPEELATKAAFARDPQLVWEWYRHRRELIKNSEPNSAHHKLVELATRCKQLLLVTQNVDDLHERARFNGWRLSRDQIVHIHGNIFASRCTKCSYQIPDFEASAGALPKCPKCGELMRPDVVWFDEELDPHEEARINRFLKDGPCDLIIVIGTTASFDYIQSWALTAAGHSGWLVEINPEETSVSIFANHTLRDKAANALPPIVDMAIKKGPFKFGVD